MITRKELVSHPTVQVAAVFVAVTMTIIAYWLVRQPTFLFAQNVDYTSLNTDYTIMVRDLIAGHGLRIFRYPPVFPLVLASFLIVADAVSMSPAVTVAVLLLGMNALNAVLLFLCARKLWGMPHAIVAPVLWLAHPATWRQFEQPLSGTLFTVFLLTAILLLFRPLIGNRFSSARAALIGTLLGLAMLTRPIGIMLPMVVAIFVLIDRRQERIRQRFATSAVLLTASIVVLAPWEIHAFRSLGEIIPLSTGGTPSILDGLSYAVDPSESRPLRVPDDVNKLQAEIYERQYQELSTTGDIVDYLSTELLARPVPVVRLFAMKAMRSWYGTDSGTLDHLLMIIQLPFIFISALGFLQAFKRRDAVSRIALLLLILVIYFWAMTTLVLSILRYMIPALMLLFMFAPAGLASIVRFSSRVMGHDSTCSVTDKIES